MVALHERYHHRAPVTAKTLMLGDDLLACVLGGVYTDVEKTMIELQRTTIVQETRSAFQNAMQHKFIATIEAPVGPRRARLHLQPPRRPRHGDRAVHAQASRTDRRRRPRLEQTGDQPRGPRRAVALDLGARRRHRPARAAIAAAIVSGVAVARSIAWPAP